MINTSYRMAPWADVLYACDEFWWDRNIEGVRKVFQGELWTQDSRSAEKYGLNHIPSERKPGLGRKAIHQGANSGYQAINLAYLWGARRIVLLGFDMGKTKRRSHWHEPHRAVEHPYDLWRHNMIQLAADLEAEGVEVLNATRVTDLIAFPRIDASSLPAA